MTDVYNSDQNLIADTGAGQSAVSDPDKGPSVAASSTCPPIGFEGVSVNSDDGWIKVHRKLLQSICWTYSLPMRSVWLTILLRANHAPAWWKGVKIEAGQFATSRDHLAHESKVTVSQLRSCWRLLSEWQQIKLENIAKRMTRVTVLNWAAYQETQPTESPTDSQPIANQSPTDSHKQECKNEKKIKTPLPPIGGTGSKPKKPKADPDAFWKHPYAFSDMQKVSLDFQRQWDTWIHWRMDSFTPRVKDPVGMFQKQLDWLTDNKLGLKDQIEALSQSIRNGWRGLFLPKHDNNSPRNTIPIEYQYGTWKDCDPGRPREPQPARKERLT